MIENSPLLRMVMDGGDFPCFTWRASSPVKGGDLTKAFLEHRPNHNWVLVGDGIAQCHMQLWTAWNSAARRQRRGTSLARSFDAEFLRYLAGTHHVSEAFKRAGVRDGDETGFFLVLPASDVETESQSTTLSDLNKERAKQSEVLASAMGLTLEAARLVCNTEGAIRLGVQIDEKVGLSCDLLIGHVLSSEFHS
jgi:hypothetical protein